MARIRTLLCDIGGVLVTNGWDLEARRAAAAEFRLDLEELNERHHLTFDTFETGRISLDEYLARVVFYEKRSFSPRDFMAFVAGRWTLLPGMWELVKALKIRHSLKTVAVSNEGREFSDLRVRRFRLAEILDVFVVSAYSGLRKPDAGIYRLALDISQTPADQAVYLEDRPMFIDVAHGLGIPGVLHRDYARTRDELARLGLDTQDRGQP